MFNKLSVLIVNINNLAYTKDVMSDLFKQDSHLPFITLIDQNSQEDGTAEFLRQMQRKGVQVVRNTRNEPLNYLWNAFYYNAKTPYLCYLNNDVRIPRNFVSDTIEILDKEQTVGAVVHATNHPRYSEVTKLKYEIMENKYVQGWDFTIKIEAFAPIPEKLKFFGGDDWLFHRLYHKGYRLACAISSPIIHYNASSRKYYPGDRNEEARVLRDEFHVPKLSYKTPYSKRKPQFDWNKLSEGEKV